MTTLEQSIFDKVVIHLRKQNAKSLDLITNACAFRGENGKKCAIGCLISDEEYTSDMESYGYLRLLEEAYPKLFVSTLDLNSKKLIGRLQRIHDLTNVESWEKGFENVVKEFNLTLPN